MSITWANCFDIELIDEEEALRRLDELGIPRDPRRLKSVTLVEGNFPVLVSGLVTEDTYEAIQVSIDYEVEFRGTTYTRTRDFTKELATGIVTEDVEA